MNIRDGSEGVPDLREFLDKLPRKPCPAKLPPEYCKICRRLNGEVADYCETRKLPDRMAPKAEEEPEAPEPEEDIRPAGIERAKKPEEPPQPTQRKSPLLERPDFHEGETSLEFVSSQRSKEEAKKSLPKFIPVKKKPRAFIPIDESPLLPPPPDDFMAFEMDDGRPSIFRSPDSLGESADIFTLVSGDDALEVEPIIVEAEVMEATETVFESSEGVVETVDMSSSAADVEIEPPVFEFLAEEEPVFAEAVEVVGEALISPEPDSLMDSIEEAEKGIQELVDEIAGTQEGSAEDDLTLDHAMFMPTPETPAGGPAPLKKKKKKIKKGEGKKPLKKKKKKIKKITSPIPAEPIPEELTPEVPPGEESRAEEIPSQEPLTQKLLKKKKKKMKMKRVKSPLHAEPTPEEPSEEESMAAEFPSQEPLAEEPPKKKKKMKLKKVKKALPAEAPPEEQIPEALSAEIPTGETLDQEPVTEEFPFGEPPEDESIPNDFLSDEALSEEPAYEETVTEEPTYEEPVTEETTSEKSDMEIAEDLESMIRSEEPEETLEEEPVVEEEMPEEPEPETPALEEEEGEGIDMESFEPPTEAGFFLTPDQGVEETGFEQSGATEEDDSDFASKMKKLKMHAPGMEITAPKEPKGELPEEEPEAEPEEPEPRKPAKKVRLKKRKKMKMKKLKMKPRKKSEGEEASEGGEDTE